MFSRFADFVSKLAGKPAAAPLAMLAVIIGLAVASLEAVNVAMSVVSLGLLFVLQHTQNRDGLAVQAKLDTIIKGVDAADDALIGIDRKAADEIEAMRG